MNYLNKIHVGDIVISDAGRIDYVYAINYEDNTLSLMEIDRVSSRQNLPIISEVFHLST